MDRHAWDERYRDKELLWTAEPNRFLVEIASGLEPGTALDLAGGEGRNAVWLAEQGWRVTVLDWSKVALEKGRTLAEARGVTSEVSFMEADLLAWEPAKATANLVLIVYLQIPAEHRASVWRNAAAAVCDGGRLVVIGHDSSNLVDGYGGPQDPAVLFTADEVAAVVAKTLSVERSERVDRPVDTEDGMRVALDNVTVAVRS
ncbi:MAG: class I SAM-dependent methyltransferase [Acidimicrobiia bacterium]